MKKLTVTEEHALYILNRDGSACPGSSDDFRVAFFRRVLDSLVRKKRATVEATDDGPRYTALPEVR